MACEFSEKVWELTRRIPEGRVSTYGQLALALGMPGAGRAVGQALKINHRLVEVPCHRVVRSDGCIGGYVGRSPARIIEKARMLRSEGVQIKGNRIDLKKFAHRF